jgi:Pyruvate/2-oxoacid:ferredoxin oxidoreductase delta subunit
MKVRKKWGKVSFLRLKMLSDVLIEKKCFKLVCGAGNEDAAEVEKLVALYAKAGARLFDLCAKPEIVDAAKRGLKRVVSEDKLHNYYFCVSVGIKGDPHVSKAVINKEKCISCGRCNDDCLQKAVDSFNNNFEINKIRCIGCGKCQKVCPAEAIEFFSENKPLNEILPPLIEKGLDCIELHALGTDEKEVDEKWEIINSCFDGLLSICIDRSKLGNEALLKRVKRMLTYRKDFTTVIQADGVPMSGSEDNFITTLQTVAAAELFQNEKIKAFIMLSGGTNSKTSELAKQCSIVTHGIAIGSFARNIVREYIDRDDFLNNQEIFDKALIRAKQLVDKTLEHMGRV